MEKQHFAVGLDIGTTKIVAMIGRKNEFGKLEILGIGKSQSLGVNRGSSITSLKPFNPFSRLFKMLNSIQELKSLTLP